MLRVTQLSGFGVGSGAAAIVGVVSAGAGSYALAGAAAGVRKPFSAGAGAYSLTGTAATITKTTTITTTLEPATISNATLSGGNLVATSSSGSTGGAHVASTVAKSSGKYYFEVTFTTVIGTGGGDSGLGVGTTASSYSGLAGSGTTGDILYPSSANVWSNGGIILSGGVFGATSSGSLYGVAVDLDNLKIWFRHNGGNWNGNATYNPATNVGGLTIPAGTVIPWLTFGGSGAGAGNVFTANFGATSFGGAVPSGFTAGWT